MLKRITILFFILFLCSRVHSEDNNNIINNMSYSNKLPINTSTDIVKRQNALNNLKLTCYDLQLTILYRQYTLNATGSTKWKFFKTKGKNKKTQLEYYICEDFAMYEILPDQNNKNYYVGIIIRVEALVHEINKNSDYEVKISSFIDLAAHENITNLKGNIKIKVLGLHGKPILDQLNMSGLDFSSKSMVDIVTRVSKIKSYIFSEDVTVVPQDITKYLYMDISDSFNKKVIETK